MPRARRLLVACIVAIAFTVGPARPAEAGPCWNQLMSDVDACASARSKCIDETSFWTRTCTIEYLLCYGAAELAFADCLIDALIAE